MMATDTCHLYNDSHLDKLNGWVLAPNSYAYFQNFDYILNQCLDYQILPLNVYFPMVFRVVHTCLAAIPVYSTIGTNGLISVTGYADLIVATQSKVVEAKFIYTQPHDDCTLQLTSFILRDMQCLNYAGLESDPTSTGTGTDTGTTDTTGGTGSGSSTKPSWSLPTRSSFFDDQRYTSLVSTPGVGGNMDSFNNPILHQRDLRLCSTKFGRFRVVMNKVSYRYAPLVCLRKGLRMANIKRSDLGGAIGIVSACLGTGGSAWIGEYWRSPASPNRCLEIVAGETARTGGISLASSCSKLQAVLCEDPYFGEINA